MTTLPLVCACGEFRAAVLPLATPALRGLAMVARARLGRAHRKTPLFTPEPIAVPSDAAPPPS